MSFYSLGGVLYDFTSCLAAWTHVPSRGDLCPMFLLGEAGKEVSVQGGGLPTES